MKNVIEQKLIKVGTSLGVTLPAKDLRRLGAKEGTRISLEYKIIPDEAEKHTLDDEYEAFKKQYGETLKNLAGR
jgi:antitoxin component of MazEF toxin-antitoxin module